MGSVKDWEAEADKTIHMMARGLVWLIWLCVAGGVLTVLATCGFLGWLFLYLAGVVNV